MNLNNSSVSFGVESNHSTLDMAILTKRPMRTRLWGGVGAGGAPPGYPIRFRLTQIVNV